MLSSKLTAATSSIFNAGLHSLFEDLVLWWDFNELSGDRIDLVSATTATDSGSIGRVAGPSAYLPYAAQFASSGSKHFSIADSLDSRLPTTGPVTYICWFYITLASGVNGDILGKGSYDLLFDHLGAPSFRLIIANQTINYSSITPTATTWYCAAFGINNAGKSFLQIDNGTEQLSSGIVARTHSATQLYLGRSVNNRYTNNRMAAFGKWNRYLSQEERDWLYNSGNGRTYPFGNLITSKPEIITPVSYQVQQALTNTTGSISITGAVRHLTSDVEASFNGGSFTTIATGVKGLFSANLTNQPIGQGDLILRAKSSTNREAKSIIGLGDIFVIAGQSNASGRSTNNQSYSHATLKAGMFGNDYFWGELNDPLDRSTNQVDSVSSDTAAGSIWPLVATSYLSARSAPCAFVPTAKGGTTISQWLPGANHQDRTTLYGSMVYRALQTGAKAILWWQGEQDAFVGTSTSSYQTSMETIISALETDLPGVIFVPAKLHKGNSYSDGNAANIQTAIQNVWDGGHSNVEQGPDLSDLRSESGDHFLNDANTSLVATRWWTALQSAFFS